jgi:hypothetical protein
VLAVIAAALVALMTAPPTSDPSSCPADDVIDASAATTEPVSTELVTAEDAENRDSTAKQTEEDAEDEAAYRDLLEYAPPYELGEPVELAPDLTITVFNIRWGEPNADGDPVLIADVRYENRSDSVYGYASYVPCSEAVGWAATFEPTADYDVNLGSMRGRSFDEGMLTMVVTADGDFRLDWVMLDSLLDGLYEFNGRWPICPNVVD